MSSLFNQASLVLVPSGYKTGKVYSQVPTSGDGDLTFTRASDATRVNSDGKIEVVGSGVPRLDYSQGSCPALLLEPQRTNLLLRSEDLTNGWNTEGLTITANQTTAPDANTTADTLQETAVTDVHRAYRNAISITSGSNYSFSFFVKKDTQRYIRLVLNQSSNSTVWVAAQFDLDTETFTSGVGSGGGTFLSASMVSAANGFYKITLVCSLATTSAFAFLVLSNGTAISSSDSRGCNVYLGDTLNRVYAWGAQLEQGAYATSYIPTTSATVTRLADSCSKTGISSLIGQTEGTLFVEVDIKANKDSVRILQISDGTIDNRIQLAANGNVFAPAVVKNGVVQAVFTPAFTPGINKLAIGYANNDIVVYLNGVQSGVDTSATIPACSLIDVGQSLGPNQATFGDGIKTAALFTTRISNSELATLTTL